MAMTSNQKAAFEAANVGDTAFTAGDLTALIAGITATAVILWFCWVAVSAYRAYGANNHYQIVDVGSVVLRALFVMIVTLVIVSF